MYAEYKRDVSHNYLILREEEKVNTASYQVRMLTGNVIPSILKCRLQGLDGNLLFYYDITSRQSLASFYEQRKFHRKDLHMLFCGFIRVMEEMAEFLTEYRPAAFMSGVYLSGYREARSEILLSSGLSSSDTGTVPGTDRIPSPET